MREPGGTSQSLWGYINNAAKDTDFGGKTGTTNNHSDAWFMCVSPKLVAGAWVGGEYRCIHFRTGALGQGSRTALPVCGYFMQSVMNDSDFRQYHAKFDKPHDNDISYGMYNCASYSPSRRDTTRIDSTLIIMEGEEILDENGNVISQEHTINPSHNGNASAVEENKQQTATEQNSKHSKPNNQKLSLEDF